MLKPTDRTVRVGLAVALSVVIGIAATAYWVTHQLMAEQQWLVLAHTAGTRLEEVLFDLTVADSVREAYLLHRDDRDLQLYNSALQAIPPKIAELKALTRTSPSQQRNFAEFELLVNQKMALMGRDLQSRMPAPARIDAAEANRLLGEQIVGLADKMYSEERQLLEARRKAFHQRYRYAVGALTLETVFSVLLLLGVFYQLEREQQRRSAVEKELMETQERFRSLVESVKDYAIVILDREGRVTTWNAGAERIQGYQPSEILGQHFSRFYAEDDIQSGKPEAALRAASEEGRFEEEGWRVRKEGTRFWADIVITPLRDAQGQLQAFAMITRDTTERKRAAEDLQQQKELMNAFFAASPVGLAIFDTQLRCQKVNGTLCAMTGKTLEQCIGKTGEQMLGDLTPPIQECLQQVVAAGRPILDRELSGPKPGERAEFCSWIASYFPVMNHDGQPRQVGMVMLDITERNRAQEALRESEDTLRRLSGRLIKLQDEERRRLARELHDGIGQSLAAVKINLKILENSLSQLASESKAAKALSESVTLADQCLNETRTISHLLHPPMLDQVGLASALRWYSDGFAERSGIRVRLDVPNDSVRLPEDIETTLFRIVQESLTNIHRHSGSPTADIRLSLDAESITLEVRDEGRGIPAHKLHGCDGKRAVPGVGIAGMRERVRQFGGRLEVSSNGYGTTVKAVLPAAGEA